MKKILNKKLNIFIKFIMTHRYHKVEPTSNNNNGFVAHDSIDFLLTADADRNLEHESIFIKYDIVVNSVNDTVKVLGDDIRLENGSVIFDQFRTEVESKGMVENLLNYPRYCSTVDKLTKSKGNLFNSIDQVEGNQISDFGAKMNAEQQCTQTGGFVAKFNRSFCVKPKICFNRAVGGQYSFKNGYIKVSCILARDSKALYGLYPDLNNPNYRITNVSLYYETIPNELANKQPMMMFSYKSIKANINSQENNISAQVPSENCSGFFMNFISQARENVFTNNSQALEVLHGVNAVRFLFNSNLGQRVAYKLEDLGEMQSQAIQVLSDSGYNQINSNAMHENNGFVLGLNFDQMVNLVNTNVQVNISLDSSFSGSVHNVYMYFMEIIKM